MKLCPRTLAQFAMVIQESSFTRAAAKLHVAQPWLSTRIKKLESQLGYELIHRFARDFRPTERGQKLYEVAARLAKTLAEAEMVAEAGRTSNHSVIRIGAPSYSAMLGERVEILSQFSQQFQAARLELDIGWSPKLVGQVLDGDLDVSFVYGVDVEPELEFMLLRQYGIKLIMLNKDALAKHDSLMPEMLKGREIVVFPRKLNPSLFDCLFQPLASYGAKLIEDIETDGIFSKLGTDHGYLIARSEFSTVPVEQGYSSRKLRRYPVANWGLIRRRMAGRQDIAEAFWEFAGSYAFGHDEIRRKVA